MSRESLSQVHTRGQDVFRSVKGKKRVFCFFFLGFKALVKLGFNFPYFRIKKGRIQDVEPSPTMLAINLNFHLLKYNYSYIVRT